MDPSPTVDLLSWSVALHNKVNTKLGRYDKWDLSDCWIAHKPNCDNCNPPPNQVFPWPFIHAVAATEHPTALEFLQRFNTLYPCNKCRGKFFDDTPWVDETVLAWTIRHHIHADPMFVYSSATVPLPCPTCPGGVVPALYTGPLEPIAHA